MRERRIIKAQEQYEEKPGPRLLVWPISEVKSSQSTQVEITQRHHWRRCHEKETEPDLYPGKIWVVRRYGEHKILDKKKKILRWTFMYRYLYKNLIIATHLYLEMIVYNF